MKVPAHFFVSYAHRNASLADPFLARLREQLQPSTRYDYALWRDSALLPGEDWDEEIVTALSECDLGLLLVSPAFLASEYIRGVELPAFLAEAAKPVIPVLLEPVDARHDQQGLDRLQIFAYRPQSGGPRKAYADCATPQRRHFVEQLFRQIEARLDKVL